MSQKNPPNCTPLPKKEERKQKATKPIINPHPLSWLYPHPKKHEF
jgi:hypothetical protein